MRPSDRSVHHSSQILTSDQETEFLATEESQCYSDTRRVDTGTLPSRRCSSLDLSNAADAAAPSPAQPQSICIQKNNMLTFTGQHRPPLWSVTKVQLLCITSASRWHALCVHSSRCESLRKGQGAGTEGRISLKHTKTETRQSAVNASCTTTSECLR